MNAASTVGMTAANVNDAAQEVFALTDEQILGMGPEEAGDGAEERSRSLIPAAKGAASARDDNFTTPRGSERSGNHGEDQDAGNTPRSLHPGEAHGTHTPRSGPIADAAQGKRDDNSTGAGQAGVTVPAEPPKWLAERMKDPWVGDEARELWAGVQKAQSEAATYREAFANPEDARALKELYPGGVSEAKSVAERARQLEEIDGVYFGAAGKSTEELRAGRAALAQRLYAQDAEAFREMVAEGVRMLGGVAGGVEGNSRSLAAAAKSATSTRDDNSAGLRQAEMTVAAETVRQYRDFEKAANAELERSVGEEIARRMEQALPNLRQTRTSGQGGGQGVPLQERLGAAAREEIDAALKSDAQLGEQVARVVAGRRFDDASRAQVVWLIDARAQQLVPGAVRKVVGQWTQATLGARGKRTTAEEPLRADIGGANKSGTAVANRQEDGRDRPAKSVTSRGRRVEYGKMSDEQILEM
jgi:hypothetical protein